MFFFHIFQCFFLYQKWHFSSIVFVSKLVWIFHPKNARNVILNVCSYAVFFFKITITAHSFVSFCTIWLRLVNEVKKRTALIVLKIKDSIVVKRRAEQRYCYSWVFSKCIMAVMEIKIETSKIAFDGLKLLIIWIKSISFSGPVNVHICLALTFVAAKVYITRMEYIMYCVCVPNLLVK